MGPVGLGLALSSPYRRALAPSRLRHLEGLRMTDQNNPSRPPPFSRADPLARTAKSDPPGPYGGQGNLALSTGTPPPAKIDPYVGKTIDGRYLVESVLGEGGMGIVYRGRHRVIDKKVAIKVLRGEMAKDKEITERFLQEARAASSIGNAHIIDISDFGQLPDGSTYFVMEYLDGESLSTASEKQRPMPMPRLLHIAKQIAHGLGAAHLAGIVHRDLKPDNIMLINRGADRDFVKILDFGIAKVGAESKITRAGSVFGTPHYMSPEQAAGTTVDKRTDIYALGIILYELACGQVPFDADNFMGILTQHMYKAPVPILAIVPPPVGVPPGMDAIIQKCLSKKPEQRYPTMAALTEDLEKVQNGLVPDAVPEMMARSGGFNVPADYFRSNAGMPAPVPGTPLGAPRTRWGLYAGVAGIATCVGLVVLIFAKSGTTHATPRPAAIVMDSVAVPPAVSAPPTVNTGTVGAVNSASTAPETTEIVISVEPPDAKVTRDGNDLGALPTSLRLKPGEVVVLEVTHAGYKTQKVSLDGSQPRMLVRMEHAAAKPGKPATPKPAQQTGPAAGDFQDPFLKK
jgi:eukaryotic-like serine/threonine-protein kinase